MRIGPYRRRRKGHSLYGPLSPLTPIGRAQAGKKKNLKPLSVGEETFALQCQVIGIKPKREYPFCEGRKWRFDFALPDLKVAIEIEGGTGWGKSRHSKGSGFEKDCEKYNTAAMLGWKVYRFTTRMVKSGEAMDFLIAGACLSASN